jgi:hypothetical protein
MLMLLLVLTLALHHVMPWHAHVLVFFFVAKKDLIALTKILTEKSRNKENYIEVLLIFGLVSVEQAAAPSKPAASPPKAWTGRTPHATRKSTLLGA